MMESGVHGMGDVDIKELKRKILEVDELVKKIHAQEAEIDEMKKETRAVTNLNETRERQINVLKNEMRDYKDKLDKAEIRNNSLKAQLSMKDSELHQLRHLQEEQKGIKPKEVERLRNSLADCESKLAALGKKYENSQRKVKQMKELVKEVHGTISSLKKEAEEVVALKEANLALELDLEMLEQSQKDLQEEHNAEKKAMEKELNELKHVRESFEYSQQLIEKLKSENRKLRKRSGIVHLTSNCDKKLKTISDCVDSIRAEFHVSSEYEEFSDSDFESCATLAEALNHSDSEFGEEFVSKLINRKGVEAASHDIVSFLSDVVKDSDYTLIDFSLGPLPQNIVNIVHNLHSILLNNPQIEAMVLSEFPPFTDVSPKSSLQEMTWAILVSHLHSRSKEFIWEQILSYIDTSSKKCMHSFSSFCLLFASLVQLSSRPVDGPLNFCLHWILAESVHQFNSKENEVTGLELIQFQKSQRWVLYIGEKLNWKSFGSSPTKRIEICEDFTRKIVHYLLEEGQINEMLSSGAVESVRCLQALASYNLKTGIWTSSWFETSIFGRLIQTLQIENNPNRLVMYACAVLASSINSQEDIIRTHLSQYLSQPEANQHTQTCIVACLGLDILSKGNAEYFASATRWYSKAKQSCPAISQLIPPSLLTDLEFSLTLQ